MLTRPSLASLLAVTAVLAASLALSAAAEARKNQRYYQPRSYQGEYQPRGYYYRQPRGYYGQPRGPSWDQLVCEERAQAADPTGQYAGYPCWAREAFGRSPGGRR